MKRFITIFVVLACGLFVASSALGQGWPLPAAPGGPVLSCAGCPSPRTGFDDNNQPVLGNPVYPYGDPIVSLTGRYLDSVFTRDYQQTFRTARAYGIAMYPEKNRMYLLIGSAIAAYNPDTFFSRLEGGESLAGSTSLGIHGNNRPPLELERLLKWNKFFYPENTGSGWSTPIVDGQERLGSFDWDDRGNIIAAYTYFGWGIVRDDFGSDGGLMSSMYQSPLDETVPTLAVSIKASNGKYYAIIGVANGTTMRLYDVTTPTQPLRLADMGRTFRVYSKSSSHIAVLEGSKIAIYTFDGLLNTQPPVQTFELPGNGGYKDITTDGTNFYAVGKQSGNSNLIVNVLTRNASGTYNEDKTTFPLSYDPYSINYGSGYLTVAGKNFSVGEDALLFRLVNGALQEIPLNNYIAKHYSVPPSGYSKANRSILVDVAPHRQGSRLYLIVAAYGLGDVYQIKSDDAIGLTVQGTAGGANPNPGAPARPAGTIFYGDKVAAVATTSGAQKPITWNWGNAEAPDNVVTGGATGVVAYHTYSGLTPATLGTGARVITATAAAANATANITLKAPVARFGVSGTNLLFTQANASSPAPIVLGDLFFDASDGDVSGHYADWKIDTAPTYTMGGGAASVGPCGTHALDFTTHYGFITAPGVAPAPDYAVTLSGGSTFRYGVQPYAAAIATPSLVGGVVTFTSASRFGVGVSPATVTYTWELLNAAGAVVQSTTGNAANFAAFQVSEATFSAAGYRARLTLTSAATTLTGCAGFTSSVATTDPINYPDPVVVGDCAGGSATACSFTVTSATQSTAGWTFAWSAAALTGGTVINGTGAGTTFSPSFGAIGTYRITVTATNNGLARSASKDVAVTSAPTCPLITMSNLYITYNVSGSPCPLGACSPGQPVNLVLQQQGYDFSCAPHTFAWKVNGGLVGTTQAATYTFPAAGTYTVTCEINNGTANTLTTTVTVGGSTQPPPTQPPPTQPPPTQPPPTQPGGCAAMNSISIFISYSGAGCTAFNGQACAAGQQMNFSAQGYNYNFDCAQHSFSWSFPGAQKSGKEVTHTFSQSGLQPVSVTVSNGSSTYTATANVNVGGGTPPPTGQCGTMSNSNVFLNFSNANGSCSNSSINPCSANDNITFNLVTSGYNFSCSNHTYTWSVDGSAGQSGGSSIQRSFSGAGSHPVTVTINNGTQSFTASTTVIVGGSTPNNGSCPSMNGTNVFMSYRNANNTCNQFGGKACSTGETIQFDAMGFNYDFGCANHTYTWDFPGGVQKTGKSVTHIFPSNGAQTVKLTINNGSQSFAIDQPLTIGGTQLPALPDVDLDFAATPVNGIANTYMFVVSANPPSVITRYEWDFGDGEKVTKTSTAPFAHSYNAAGIYTVTVTAYYQDGRVLKTATKQIVPVSRKRGARH